MKTGLAAALVALGLLSARGEESFSSLLLSQLKSDDYAERYEAARDLASVEGDARLKAVPALIAGLDDRSLPFRWRCARSLAALTGQDFGRDHDRWEAWWKTGPVLPATEPPPALAKPLPKPSVQVTLEAGPAVETRDLETRVMSLTEERDRMAGEEARLRDQLEALRKERDRMAAAPPAAESTLQELERTQKMAVEVARLKEESDRRRAEADRSAHELETVSTLRQRVQGLEKDLAERSEALGRLQAQYQEARTEAQRPPPASDEAMARDLARLKEECDRQREESEQRAKEIAELREKLAEPPARPPREDAEEGAERDLTAWRARHQRIWHNVQYYVIQKDDSLSTIAHRFHTDVDTILALNRDHPEAVQDRHHIYAGYRIAVPAP